MDISNIKTDDLLNMVNSALKEGISVNKFSKNNNWNSSTVKTRLKRGGYCYNTELNNYVVITKDNTNNNTKSNIDIDTKDNIKNNTKENTEYNTNNSIKNNTKKNTKKNINDNTNCNTEIEKLIIKLDLLEKRLSKLENKKEIKKGKYYIENTRDTSTKSIRLYTEVKEQLDNYLSENKDKKVIEVFSYAILDYINK